VLVVGASLAIQGYATLAQGDTGLRAERLFEVGVRIPPRADNQDNAAERSAFLRDLSERVRRLSTVESAALQMWLSAPGYQVSGATKRDDARMAVHAIGAGYLQTMGIPVRMGRDLSETEIALGQPAALINEAARQLWPSGQTPLGERITLFGLRGPAFPPIEATVVGIVGNVQPPGATPVPIVFIPFATNGLPPGLPALTVRTRHEQPLQSVDAVRAQAFSLNPGVLLLRPVDVEELFMSGRLQPRFNMWLFGGLAAIALALAAAGIYASLSYHVARQRRDIGIRLALGAGGTRIISMVLGRAARLVGIGLALGVAASVALARLVRSQVFTVPETDPLALLVAVVVLTGVAACACYVPARRAARIDPLTVLRSE
jgi:hypothetical protein